MLLTSTYNPLLRVLTLTDATGTVSATSRRVLFALDGSKRREIARSTGLAFTLPAFTQDGPYQFVVERQSTTTGNVLDTSPIFTHIESGTQQRTDAELYLRHALRPFLRGNDVAYRQEWVRLYAQRASAAESNPSHLRKLVQTQKPVSKGADQLPYLLPALPVAPGLPGPATGLYWQLDQPAPGFVSVHADLGNPVGLTVTVTSPTGANVPETPTLGLNRLSVSFPAAADGLYRVALTVGGAPVAVLYVPVLRTSFAEFRALVRELAISSGDRSRKVSEKWLPLLSRLAGIEAACRTGQPELANAGLLSISRLKKALTPTATYPRQHG